MRNRFFGSLMAVAAFVSLVPVLAAGQAPAAAAKTRTLPRTEDGQPNIQGFWRVDETGGSGKEGFPRISIEGANDPSVREHVREHDLIVNGKTGRIYHSVVVDPPDGKIPYQPWAAAKRKEYFDNSTNPTKMEYMDGRSLCYPPGVPRQIWSGGPQIIQTPGYVVMLIEEMHAYRIIPLDGRPHVEQNIKLYQGDSRGHWEGNTLVVDVTNQIAKNWFDNAGDFYSDALHVVERWTVVDADTILYEVTLQDPKVFTRPWKMVFPISRDKDEGFELLEHACHEGNRAMQHMFQGGAK